MAKKSSRTQSNKKRVSRSAPKQKKKVTTTVFKSVKTSLGSPPEVHARGAKVGVKAQRFHLASVRRALKYGWCAVAVRSAAQALRSAGRAGVHAVSGGRRRGRAGVSGENTALRALERVISTCKIGDAVSGGRF